MYDGRDKKIEYKTFIFTCHTGTECQLDLALARAWPAAISLRSSISKTLTAATSSIQMELAFGAGVAVENESFVFCLFVTAIVHYNRSDL